MGALPLCHTPKNVPSQPPMNTCSSGPQTPPWSSTAPLPLAARAPPFHSPLLETLQAGPLLHPGHSEDVREGVKETVVPHQLLSSGLPCRLQTYCKA